MNIEELKNIENESERVSKLYEIFNEDNRILETKAGNIEFLTTIKYINKVLKPKDKILDIGAGTGVYSFYFDKLGYSVSAVELANRNIEVFKSKMTKENHINLIHGNALDLSMFDDETFDVVLLFGPLYHLEAEEDRNRAISEAKRVLKNEGKLFVSFINHDFIHISETQYNYDWFEKDLYHHETYRIENFPFIFFTLEECREMLVDNSLTIEKEIASDGVSELLAEKINLMSDDSYEQYKKFHLKFCEDPYRLKSTNHFLFQCKK